MNGMTMTEDIFSEPGGGSDSFDTDWSPYIGDKRVKILDYMVRDLPMNPSMETNTFAFAYDSGMPTMLPFHTDLDMYETGDNTAGFIEYLIEIDPNKVVNSPDGICGSAYPPCHPGIEKISFGANLSGDTTGTAFALKTIMDVATGDTIAELMPGEMYTFTGALPTTLKINISWDPGDGVVDNVTDNYKQSPGPLPLLGAGAAFGFSRKLRGRIKGSRTA